jgi:PTH1 family peptidyl-tRNA hydrolase
LPVNIFKRLFAGQREIEPEEPIGMTETRLIVGLGNPGREYEKTRHNVGFRVVDSLAQKLGVEVKDKKFGGLMGQAEYDQKKLILLKPQEFMNLSGQAVSTVMGFYKLKLSDLLVILDDMALEPGIIRVRTKGSSGGQKGLTNIIQRLGSNEFARIRVGIGKSPFADSSNYVLGVPGSEEQALIDESIKRARDAAICWVTEGTDKAMNKFNAGQTEQ